MGYRQLPWALKLETRVLLALEAREAAEAAVKPFARHARSQGVLRFWRLGEVADTDHPTLRCMQCFQRYSND